MPRFIVKKGRVTSYLLSLFVTSTVSYTAIGYDSNKIANALGWVTTKKCDVTTGFCNGYYAQPKVVTSTPNPPPIKSVPVTITAKGPVIFRANGTSVLEDDVVIVQPGRHIRADKATLYRDPHTNQISDIALSGNVRAEENGKLLVGDKANYNVEQKIFTINHAIYHIVGIRQNLTLKTPLDAWGTAQKAVRDQNSVLYLTDATYTTCSPVHPTWQLSATTMKLDKPKGVGYAKNIVIKVKKVPIFYLPYFSFPLNKERKTGFLTPTFGSSNNFGFFVGEPYYVNLAPNYDLLVTPGWYTQRGAQISENFRYLTQNSDGYFYASVLPNDTKFGTFRDQTLASYTPPYANGLAPYISELQSDSDFRGYFDFEDHTKFSDKWQLNAYLRYVTDSYYNQDFQSQYLSQNTNQLPSYGELLYNGQRWEDAILIQSYETLHPITQFNNNPAQNQYYRLPEWDFGAQYPQIARHLNFDFSGQFVDFVYQSDYSPYTYQMPIGERVHLQPAFSTPFNWASYYVNPQLTMDNTSYLTELPTANSGDSRPDFDRSRTIPVLDIDTGWYLDHSLDWGNHHYIQTLEPRLFYLYVPYVDQSNYPNFDTQLLPFSTTNFYSLNQFTGFDRLQNANQMTLGVTSQLLRRNDGTNTLTAELGTIRYFEPQKVCLTSGCSPGTDRFSPLTGSLTWNPNPLWSVTSQIAWSIPLDQMNNAQLGAQYHFHNNHVFIFNYQFTEGGNTNTFGLSNNSSLITGGLIWPLSPQWTSFIYSYYDLSNRHAITQYAGLAYETCCWAFRFIAEQNYNGNNSVAGGTVAQSEFDNSFFFQFELKGLGSAGNRNSQGLLASTLPGFIDPLSNSGTTNYGIAH